MTLLIVILSLVLIAVVAVQVASIKELAGKIRGEEAVVKDSTNKHSMFMLVFLVLFLFGCVASAIYYAPYMLAYGANESASVHGGALDSIFNITLFFTGIVFIVTHIVLFWFAYKYRASENRPSKFFAHDTKLEIIWTAIPAVVMAYLVITGLSAWGKVMADVPVGAEVIEVEATGYQFAWDLRHPGRDNLLGTKNYKLISGENPLGQDWNDPKNVDDFMMDELVLPVGKKVRVRITAKDVLHNFYLPHFRVKMDAIPGMPTYFVFEPKITTAEYRQKLKNSNLPMWLEAADPENPNGPKKWETFNYELACAELCGKGHYSMRKVVKIVTPEEYEKWLKEQESKSFYMQNVRGKANDPFKGKELSFEKYLLEQKAIAAAQDTISAAPAPVDTVGVGAARVDTVQVKTTKTK